MSKKFICKTTCFFDGRVYEVGDQYEGNAQPNKHFQDASVPLAPELPPIPPGKVRRISPAADVEKGLNGIE